MWYIVGKLFPRPASPDTRSEGRTNHPANKATHLALPFANFFTTQLVNEQMRFGFCIASADDMRCG